MQTIRFKQKLGYHQLCKRNVLSKIAAPFLKIRYVLFQGSLGSANAFGHDPMRWSPFDPRNSTSQIFHLSGLPPDFCFQNLGCHQICSRSGIPPDLARILQHPIRVPAGITAELQGHKLQAKMATACSYLPGLLSRPSFSEVRSVAMTGQVT